MALFPSSGLFLLFLSFLNVFSRFVSTLATGNFISSGINNSSLIHNGARAVCRGTNCTYYKAGLAERTRVFPQLGVNESF